MQQLFQCPNCAAPVAFGVRFCGNCGAQLKWPTQHQPPSPPQYQQQMQPPRSYQEKQQCGYGHGQVKVEQEKPKQTTNPIVEGIRWIFFLFVMLPIFVVLLFWWYFRCFVGGATGNLAFDTGRFVGGIAALLLLGWFITWLTKKRNKGDNRG